LADENTFKFKAVTVILAIIGAAAGLTVPFNKMMNVVYIINGYVGIIFLFFMIMKSLIKRTKN